MAERTREPGVRSAVEGEVDGRTYDERQVAEILQRATSLEQKKQLQRPALTLGEIEAIARDVGIDPASVRQAARDVELKGDSEGLAARLAGAPLRRTLERVVDGEVGPEHHEALANAIRAALGPGMGLPVQVATLGRSLSVGAVTRAGVIDVQISPRAGKTHLRITVNAGQQAGGIFGGLMGGLGGGLGSNVAWLVPTLLIKSYGLPPAVGVAAGVVGLLAAVGGAYALARTIFSSLVGSTHRRMDQLADTLEGQVREALTRR